MTLHPLDPTGGFRLHAEAGQSATVELADSLLLHAHQVSWSRDGGGSHLVLAYAHREIVARRDANGALFPVQDWASNDTLGAIPLSGDQDTAFGERVRRSLLDAFGADAQDRLRAVLTLARLRQDIMGWLDADLVLNPQNPRGLLRSQRGSQKLSTILLKANRGRRPPDLDAFLGPACQLRLTASPHERIRILQRPEKAGPRFPTGHGRMGAVLDLLALFATHGIDLSPWQNDLLT